MSAAKKRSWLASFLNNFDDGNKYQIYEEPRNKNKGPTLDNWLKKYKASPHWNGAPWCASFVSAMAYWTDEKSGISGPTRKFNNASSQHSGAGLFSRNVKDAVPGVAISWKNIGSDGGHVGIVVSVSSSGAEIAEGDTSAKVKPQNRDGGISVIKKYTWAQLQSPSNTGTRKFNAYYKLWPEENDELKKELPGGTFAESEVTANIPRETTQTRAETVRSSAEDQAETESNFQSTEFIPTPGIEVDAVNTTKSLEFIPLDELNYEIDGSVG